MKPEDYPTTHQIARQLLEMPDLPLILPVPVFDLPGVAKAMSVNVEQGSVEGRACVLVRPNPIGDAEPPPVEVSNWKGAIDAAPSLDAAGIAGGYRLLGSQRAGMTDLTAALGGGLIRPGANRRGVEVVKGSETTVSVGHAAWNKDVISRQMGDSAREKGGDEA